VNNKGAITIKGTKTQTSPHLTKRTEL